MKLNTKRFFVESKCHKDRRIIEEMKRNSIKCVSPSTQLPQMMTLLKVNCKKSERIFGPNKDLRKISIREPTEFRIHTKQVLTVFKLLNKLPVGLILLMLSKKSIRTHFAHAFNTLHRINEL